MTSHRSPSLQMFLNAAEAAIRDGCRGDLRVRLAADRIFTALQTPPTQDLQPEPSRLPVCRHLEPALDQAVHQPGPVHALANTFAVIEPQLGWKRRPGAAAHGEPFLSAHANATILGAEGLEIRDDVWIGVSLLAPHTRYPDHQHPPEEVYVVLSEGQWRQARGPWHEPGIGGLVYNPPNIVHAMRSGERPLLALWILWTGQADT
jgi:quercetin dioxygenase-like cupin family protein